MNKDTKLSITYFIGLILILFLDSTGLNSNSVIALLGKLFGSLALGRILSRIYFKVKKTKDIDREIKITTLIALILACLTIIPTWF